MDADGHHLRYDTGDPPVHHSLALDSAERRPSTAPR
jgi:hypothetical protein